MQHVQPLVGHARYGLVRLRQGGSLEEEFEDLLLEDLDELELTPALDLEPLQLREGAVVVEDGVSLLEVLVLLLGRRQDHGPVGSVDLEEDGVVAVCLVSESLGIRERLVLVVGEAFVDEMVEHDAWIGDG